MEQNYFTANKSTNELPDLTELKALGVTDDGYNAEWNSRRLKLEAVHMTADDVQDSSTYRMEYNEKELPTKLSASLDHWGYYNGQYNGTLIDGRDSDRDAYSTYNQAFILTKLKYPTGGFTVFDYETNQYDPANMEGDPHKVNYYSSQIETVLEEGEGYHNVPGYAVSSKAFTVPSISSPGKVYIKYNVDINVKNYNLYFTADMSLTMSLIQKSNGATIWSKILKVEELPLRDDMTEETSIFSGQSNMTIGSGEYELQITGSLRKVIDKTTFTAIRYSSAEEFLAAHTHLNGGGVRIKEMATYTDSTTCASRRTFDYTVSNGRTSGKIMSFPRYNTGYMTYSSNALRNSGYSVGYSKVTVNELDNLGNSNGRTEYEFVNRPDSNYCYSWEVTEASLNAVVGKSVDANPIGVMAHRHPENGTLLKESRYDGNGSLKEVTEHTYADDDEQFKIIWGIAKDYGNIDMDNAYYRTQEQIQALRTDPSTGSSILSGNGIPMGYVYPAIQPTHFRHLKTVNKIYHEYGNALTTSLTYTYDDIHPTMVKKEEAVRSDGSNSVAEYFYPFDFSTSVMARMEELNMISEPVKTLRHINGKMVREDAAQYAVFNSDGIPRTSSHGYRTVPAGNMVVSETINSYDSMGNPQWITSKELDIVYLWGYGGQYPIAEIRNATPEEIRTALGTYSGLIDSMLSTESPVYPTMEKLDGLRTALPDAMVTTMTYRPGVGPLSITDARGVIRKYYYDGFGRLIKVTEKTDQSSEENIISFHSYNYAKQ